MSDVEGASAAHEAQRIGDAERDAATRALNAHREAGRLDAVEYEDRQVQVTRARTWAEIQPVFADLPEPHPVGMPAALTPLAGGPLSGQVVDRTGGGVDRTGGGAVAPQPSAAPVPGRGILGAVVPEQYRSTVMALTPFLATLLFFGTGTWLWFLAIPVMGILLYGADSNEEPKRQERREREERRRIERENRRNR
jgi:hypothetical protein